MAHKRKRGQLELPNQPDGQLCEKCRFIFATIENLRMLASTGFKHYNRLELLHHATQGCTLCGLLFKRLENIHYQKKLNTTSLLLQLLSHRGSRALKTEAKSRYPGVVMNASCLWAHWEGGVSHEYTFDIVSAQDQRTRLEFPVVPLNYHTNGELVIAEIHKRLKICQERHACSSNSIPYLPTRVIDVGSVASKQPLHLRVSQKDEKGCYAALSYCWGGPQRITTTLDTIDAYRKTLPASTLPKTIQGAIKVTQKLGIRYLWVDAFCIIQKSPKDLATEIDAMGTIYNQATITIAAIGAASVEDGFLQWFSGERSGSLSFQLPKGLLTSVAVTEKWPDWIGGRLDKRAWGFQEFHLSTRLLLYGSNGDLRWHCEHDQFTPLFGTKPSLMLGRKHSYLKMGDRSNRPHSSPVMPWGDLVEQFSQRILTYAEDRLPALAGIARYMSGILQDDYLAGVWRSDIIAQLGWSILPGTPGYFQPCSTAPSWSWASVNRPIHFNQCFGEPEAQAVSCTVDPIDKEAPFGKVREGVLKIQAPVLIMNAISRNEQKWQFTMDNPGQAISD